MTVAVTVFFAAAPTAVLLALLYALRRQLRENLLPILALALFALLFFRRIVFLPETISQSDANLLQLQFFRIYREAVLQGQPPFWNPYEGAGLPNLAHPLSAMFYPLTPLFLLVNVFRGMSVFVVLHYFAASVFALLLARRFLRTRPAALAFALLFAYNGWAVTRAAHQPAIEYLFAYTWLALAALFFERGIDGKSLLVSAAGIGSALAWMGIACPNLFVYAVVLFLIGGVIRIAVLAFERRWNAVALSVFLVVASAGFAAGLSAVELVPAFEQSLLSTEGRMGAEFLGDYRGRALSPWEMARFFFPYTPNRPFAVYYSPGILALVACLYALYRAGRSKAHRALMIGALVVLAAGALVCARTFLYGALGAVVPFFARASLVPSGLILLFLPVVVLAAVGIDLAVGSRRRFLGRWGWVLPLAAGVELFGLFSVVYPRYGERRLTYNYRKEVSDFPHLDVLVREGHAGRVVVSSPLPQKVLAPSYAALERGLPRLNLHLSAFAGDLVTKTLARTVEGLSPDELEILGAGWVISTKALPGRRPTLEVAWPGCMDHFENSLFHPLRNRPGWLDWDKTVRLYRVSASPSLARGQSWGEPVPVELAGSALPDFDSWAPLKGVEHSANRFRALPGEDVGRVFFAVAAYPGWEMRADGRPVDWRPAGEGFIAADLPGTTGEVTLEFTPTAWLLCVLASAGAVLFALAAAALDTRGGQSA
ncbi:MAG: hypothetical protein ACYTAN_02285 [Planctomycetota bacterium]